MSDRVKKPGTTSYLLRDIPKARLRKAHKTLNQQGKGETLKSVLLDAIERLAIRQDRE